MRDQILRREGMHSANQAMQALAMGCKLAGGFGTVAPGSFRAQGRSPLFGGSRGCTYLDVCLRVLKPRCQLRRSKRVNEPTAAPKVRLRDAMAFNNTSFCSRLQCGWSSGDQALPNGT